MNDIALNRLLVVLRHGPHGSSWLREGLEVALVGAALGQDVSLLFYGEGVTALLKEQQVGPLAQKGTQPMLEMLPMYDIESLWVDAEALGTYDLTLDELVVPAKEVGRHEVSDLFQRHRLVLNF